MPTAVFSVAASADDGYISRNQSTISGWPPTGGASTVDTTSTELSFSVWDIVSPNYYLGVLLMKWDTSQIPLGAIINSADLLITTADTGVSNPNNAQFYGDWFNWSPADSTDWTASSPTTARTAYLLSNISVTPGDLNTIPLTGLSGITPGGTTQLRLSGMGTSTAPAARNYVAFASYDSTLYQEPQLRVNYTVPLLTQTFSPIAVY